MSVNGPISPKQCYYEMDYSFYSFYWLDSLEIRLDHNSSYYRWLSKNSDVKPRISHCDYQDLQYKTHPEFWPSHRRIFKTSLYYKTRLILETRRYILSKFMYCRNLTSCEYLKLKGFTCAQSHALGTRTKFQLEILTIKWMWFLALYIFARLFWRAHETLVKQHPDIIQCILSCK